MSRSGMRQDQLFWQMVKDMQWRLDDGHGSDRPPVEPEFEHGGRPERPSRSMWTWSTHIFAFVLGAVTFGLLLTSPALVPAAGLCAAGVVAAKRFSGGRR